MNRFERLQKTNTSLSQAMAAPASFSHQMFYICSNNSLLIYTTLFITIPEKQNHKHKPAPASGICFLNFHLQVFNGLLKTAFIYVLFSGRPLPYSASHLFFFTFSIFYYVSFSSSVLCRFRSRFSLVPVSWFLCLFFLAWFFFLSCFRASCWFVCPRLVGFFIR